MTAAAPEIRESLFYDDDVYDFYVGLDRRELLACQSRASGCAPEASRADGDQHVYRVYTGKGDA